MRTLTPQLAARIAGGSTALARLYTITRKDGVIKRFTDLDHDVTFSANVYASSHSINISAISSTSNNGIQASDAMILFEDTVGVSEVDVVRGIYDTASFKISIIDYEFPAYGEMIILAGQFGSIEVTNKYFGNFEIRGLLNRADSKIGETYSAECRADLGDIRCTVPLASFTRTGVVTTVTSASKLRVQFSLDVIDGFFSFGVLTWTSGLNAGMSIEILNQFSVGGLIDQVTLALAMPYPVQVADTFSIVAGCDKRKATCIDKFDNILNFRGEPFVPGDDIITDRPFNDTL